MRNTIALIPNFYMDLTLTSDVWFSVVATISVALHVVMKIIQWLVLWPLHRILDSLYYAEAKSIEYFSASCLYTFIIWLNYGKQEFLRVGLLNKLTFEHWFVLAFTLATGQVLAAAYGSYGTRATMSMFTCFMWLWLSFIIVMRIGFALDNVFCFWLLFALFLKALGLVRRANGPTNTRC